MAAQPVSAEATKVIAYSRVFMQLVLTAGHKSLILAPLTNKEAVDRIGDSQGGHSYGVLLTTLRLDLIKDLVALTTDRDARSPSLATIIELLKKPTTVAELRDLTTEKASGYEPAQGDLTSAEVEVVRTLLRDHEATGDAAAFDADMAAVVRDAEALLGSNLAKRLREARNKAAAHYDMTDENGLVRLNDLSHLNLLWEEVEKYLSDLEELAERLLVAVAAAHYPLEEWRRRHRDQVNDFWARLESIWRIGVNADVVLSLPVEDKVDHLSEDAGFWDGRRR